MDPLSLLTVHAHPDDEASKGAGTVRRYADEGVRTTLVCCTSGDEGDVLNPELDAEAVRAELVDVRMRELEAAAEVIGYDEVRLLGYRDSGMAGSASNDHPASFHQAPLDQAVDRLVEIIRVRRPQVVVTYSDDQRGYPHPDHLKVHDITGPAFDAAADPGHRPELGEAWQPLKLYYTVWSRARLVATHERFLELGLESPYDEKWFERPDDDHRVTTQVRIDPEVRRLALLCHRTQIDPSSPFWFGLPPEVAREVHPFDDYVLARSLVEADPADERGDLFAGVRAPASR